LTGTSVFRAAVVFLVTLVLPALAMPLRAEEAGRLNGVALVIGQSAYTHIDTLPNPVNDARDMVKLLTDLGFDARSVSDRDARKLKRDLERFAEDAEGADVAILYYSGHGIESGGENWLVPVDADIASLDNASETLVPLSAVMDELKATVPVTIMLLDACRTNPFPAGAMIRVTPSGSAEPIGDGGLTPVRGAKAIAASSDATESLGTVIGFAAEPGRPALDGPAGQNSPYAAALLRHLAAMKGVEFGSVMRMVTEEVYLDTRARQRPWVNESLRRLLYFGVAPDEPEGDEGLITGERRKLLLTISDLPDINRAQIETAAAKDDVPLDALFGVLRAMGTSNIPEDPTELGRILDAQSARLKEMFAEKAALRSDDPEIARLTASADRAMRQGAIETSRKFLDEAVARVEASAGAVDQAEELLKQKRLADAAVYAKRAEAAALAFDNIAAADDYARAAELVERWDGKLSRNYALREGNALFAETSSRHDRKAFDRAMAVFRALEDSGTAEERRVNRPVVLNQIALLLQLAGERDADGKALNEALAMFSQALVLAEELGDEENGANIQNNIGNVLLELAKRDRDTARLEQAVAAYRAALDKRPREALPLDWASSQNNIGVALQLLAERETQDVHLVESEAAYRQALDVYSRDRTPVEWAMVQNNLGNALIALGTYRNDPALFDAAAQAFRAALQVRTREHLPRSWAASRLNLGNALSNTTRFDLSTNVLEEAATAYQDALTVFKRTSFPLDWASVQNNLGSVYQTLGQRTGDAAKLEASAGAFRNARRIYKRSTFPLDWAMTHYNLGNTLQLLGAVTGNSQRYREAASAYRDALQEYRRETTPRQWAMAQAGMGAALHWLSNDETSTASLVESIAARRAALEVLTMENAPIDWANAQNGLGMSLINLGNRETTGKYLADAAVAFEASLRVFTRESQPLQWAFGQNNLGDVHWNLASYGGGGRQDYERAIASFERARQAFVETGYLATIPLIDQKIELARKMMAGK
jgi:uncharacterized caspase-like protein